MSDLMKPGPTPGKKNIYVCQTCFGHIVTRDVCDGVTPFMLKCRATQDCNGSMESSFYRVFRQDIRASYEWYSPDLPERASLSHGVREHVAKGGLLLRAVPIEGP